MRKSLAAVAVFALVLATAGVALAAFTQHATVQFTATKAKQSTGIKSNLHASYSAGDTLKAPKIVLMAFPTGTKFNLGTPLVKKHCTKPPACPAASQIGTGSGSANLGPTANSALTVPLTVKAYVQNRTTMVLVVKSSGPTQVIKAVASGRQLKISVPKTMLGPTQVFVTSLKLNVTKKGTGRRALITSGRCTAHAFTTTVSWMYYSGTTDTATATSKCS